MPTPNVVPLQRNAPALPERPHINELEMTLIELGDDGYDPDVPSWERIGDMPLTAGVGKFAILALTQGPRDERQMWSRNARDTASQFLQQALAFEAAVRAINERNPTHLMRAALGNATPELRSIIDAARGLLAPDGLESPSARAAVTAQLQSLAALLASAAVASRAWSKSITKVRDDVDGERMARRVVNVAARRTAEEHEEE